MAGDTHGSDTVHTRYARKGTPTSIHYTGSVLDECVAESQGQGAG